MPVVDDYTAILAYTEGEGFAWNAAYGLGTPVVITYSFLEGDDLPDPSELYYEGTGTYAFDAAQRANTVLALEEFSATAGIVFVEVESGEGMIDIHGAEGSEFGGWAPYPYSDPYFTAENGTLVIDGEGSFAPGTSEYTILLHEIGHALGLQHPFEGPNILSEEYDTKAYTVMSYDWSVVPSGLQPLDEQALVHIYGDPTGVTAAYVDDQVIVTGTNGGDVLAATNLDSFLKGLGGDDILLGRENDDLIRGHEGRDVLAGYLGDDTLRGDGGADVIFGAFDGAEDLYYYYEDDDTAFGGGGDDLIFGQAGDDVLRGEGGDDTVDGGAGDDIVWGGGGADELHGGDGDDLVKGHNDDDLIFGGEGSDHLVGGNGDDVIEGGGSSYYGNYMLGNGGDDTLIGGSGNDEMLGQAGSDTLIGGAGGDVMRGGGAGDRFVFDASDLDSSWNHILDFNGSVDVIDLSATGYGASDLFWIWDHDDAEHGAGALVQFGEGSDLLVIHLAGHDAAEMDASDFFFG